MYMPLEQHPYHANELQVILRTTVEPASLAPAARNAVMRINPAIATKFTTLDAILDLPAVVGIKVATLDSVMTFQHVAEIVRRHPGKLLITGEDRFLGYSIMMGADAAALLGVEAGKRMPS